MELSARTEPDSNGPQYALGFWFNEADQLYYAADQNRDGDWVKLGSWSDASLWVARELLALGSPVLFEAKAVGCSPSVSMPAPVVRTLSNEAVTQILIAERTERLQQP